MRSLATANLRWVAVVPKAAKIFGELSPNIRVGSVVAAVPRTSEAYNHGQLDKEERQRPINNQKGNVRAALDKKEAWLNSGVQRKSF
ncbi:hypothetical protein J6590_018275 [Homalodisca vitripennis]|nr:hypothetical protein J6590_018275 [Homalodisca vitripennis]